MGLEEKLSSESFFTTKIEELSKLVKKKCTLANAYGYFVLCN